MRSCFISGQKLQHVHRGVELGCTASLRVQLEGTRIIVMARLAEVAKMLSAENPGQQEWPVTDCVDWLLRLEEVPPATSIPSLVAGVCKVGDLIYQPAGYVIIDKACVENNVSLTLGCIMWLKP